ncbi:phosphoglycolate phosphatase [Synechocystis sp. PCC 6803]|jgi:phosphoglycolate phosphatase|uniref:Phosphoglycolate phosphatase n=1 Tax=Synechocystis sp. (strain ATCC 27184 / PCC 6803 / Kazusa) TaxID=1111708 RepID=P73525_SYNY3|nr:MULTISPECIES: HAD-IA family hydrolase [unclassified Synechocystis]BAM51305.1 phosphoglycolate phosphatase [Synechocystis sp. PCC 6803] [Bacillus subtilis BEST7613]AGF51254.1 phosphoglycolate phosphatase [Synechocystis sp. PCC 6803]ALJ67272.1 carotenoid oxygenase [Synechocystis sp. PCC 6803]AVP89112.1 carotenoid oxygenase [Synechocystis sp. IPPAS B-1465]MBD2618481.1 HAD-IA family hydrolase [Synechocystis sp. FACHB-898]
MAIKAVLFDFDGTIADTHDAFFAIVNRLADEFGYPAVDKTELARLKKLSSAEIIKYSQISPFKIPFILKRFKKELGKEIKDLKPYGDIKEVLTLLNQKGYVLGIVTSNSKDNVLSFLHNNGLEDIFAFVKAGTTLFGKNRIINRVLKEHKFGTDEVIYVGDETRDISAAKKSRLTMVSVAWGFSPPAILQEYEPDFLVHQPKELLTAIASLDNHRWYPLKS